MVYTLTGFLVFLGIMVRLSIEDGETCYLENRTLVILILISVLNSIFRLSFGLWTDWGEAIFFELMIGVLGIFTKEKMGEGDLIVLSALPLNLSIYDLWIGLMSTFVLLVPMAILLWFQKKDRKTILPFIPFLTSGMVMGKIIELWP